MIRRKIHRSSALLPRINRIRPDAKLPRAEVHPGDALEKDDLVVSPANSLRECEAHEFHDGYVKLYRSLLDSEWIRNPEIWRFYTYCLMKATYKSHTVTWRNTKVDLDFGQFVVGRKRIAADLDLSEGKARGLMKRAASQGLISIKVTKNFTIITVTNYKVDQHACDNTTTYKNKQLEELISIKDVIYSQGLTFKEKGEEIILKFCPICEDKKWHLYINHRKEVYRCYKCEARGSFHTLYRKYFSASPSYSPIRDWPRRVSNSETNVSEKKISCPSGSYIDQCHRSLLGPHGKDAMAYLQGRRITPAAIKFLHLGFERKYGNGWIVIPYLLDGRPVNVKYRSLPPREKQFRRWPGGESILFNRDCLSDMQPQDELLLVEGELDLIALLSQGFCNVVSTSLGAGTFTDKWVRLLERFEKIIIVYDSDEKGQEGALQAAKLLGLSRCRSVVLPTKDVNDFFIEGHDRTDFEELLSKSTNFVEKDR